MPENLTRNGRLPNIQLTRVVPSHPVTADVTHGPVIRRARRLRLRQFMPVSQNSVSQYSGFRNREGARCATATQSTQSTRIRRCLLDVSASEHGSELQLS